MLGFNNLHNLCLSFSCLLPTDLRNFSLHASKIISPTKLSLLSMLPVKARSNNWLKSASCHATWSFAFGHLILMRLPGCFVISFVWCTSGGLVSSFLQGASFITEFHSTASDNSAPMGFAALWLHFWLWTC